MTLDRDKVKTREEMRNVRVQEKQTLTMREKRKKIRVRLLPVWIKVLIVIFLFFVSIIAGTIVGYGVIGNGKPSEAFHKKTWTHIVDIINKK